MNENSEKISEILTLSGVPRRDFDVARRSLQKLNTEELDSRLNRLQARGDRMKAWRKARTAAVLGVSEGISYNAFKVWHERIDAELRGMLEMTKTLGQSSSEVESYIAQFLDILQQGQKRLTEDEDRLTEGRVDVGAQLAVIKSTAEGLFQRLLYQVSALSSHNILPKDRPVVSGTGAIDAFARLENNLVQRRPDVLVATNEEGLNVARVLVHDLGMENLPIVKVTGSSEDLHWNSTKNLKSGCRVAIVGHAAHSGLTLMRTLSEARQKFGSDVYCMVLASSENAATKLSSECDFIFHHLSLSGNPLLDFDPARGVKIEVKENDRKYVFVSAKGRVPIHSDSLKVARRELAEAFPDGPLLPATLFGEEG